MDGGYELTEIMVRDVHAREILYRAYGCGGEVSEAAPWRGIDLLEPWRESICWRRAWVVESSRRGD